MKKGSLNVGLSGVVLPYPKYKFPEEAQKSSRLTLYAGFFNSIEVNDSFYKVPQRKTIERWASAVPDNFTFTFKLHQDITHQKFLEYDVAHIAAFVDTISSVGNKKASILVQFPPSLKASSIAQLESLIRDLKSCVNNTWNIAVEFRDSGWYHEETFDLLKSHNASLVLQDIPKSASPFALTSDQFVYVRFHGPTGTYRGSYAETFLSEYVSYVQEWTVNGKDVFVYFNNTAGSAFENGQTFLRLLKQSIGR